MALKAVLAAKADVDALPEAVKALYVERDGKFILDVDGMIAKADLDAVNSKLAEFRDNNRTLNQQLAELPTLKTQLAKFDGVDPEEYKTLKQKLKDKGVDKADELETRLQQMIKAVVDPLQEKLTAAEQREVVARRVADAGLLRAHVAELANKKGVKSQYLSYLQRDAEEVFVVKDGKVVAKDGNYSKTNAAELLSPVEWLDGKAQETPDFFNASSGGGALNNNGQPGSGPRVIGHAEPMLIGQNLADIASGKATVALPS